MFAAGVLYYLVRVLIFGTIAGLGIFFGVKLRKNKDAKGNE